MGKTGGGRGTNQYGVKGRSVEGSRLGRENRRTASEAGVELPTPQRHYRAVPPEQVRIPAESACDLSRFRAKGIERAMTRYREYRPHFVFSAAHLEGNTITLPEVYTLLDKTTPDGKEVGDVTQVLALGDASEHLLRHVEDGTFRLGPDLADELNGIIARDEALDAGVRRIDSAVNPDGRGATVNVRGDVFVGWDKAQLAAAEPVLAERTSAIKHPVLRGAVYAALSTYAQAYHDGNKRTARYMMDGELLAHGFDAAPIPARRAAEYQDALAAMFAGADTTPYVGFLLDVVDRGDPVD